jgi:hypothetical protein
MQHDLSTRIQKRENRMSAPAKKSRKVTSISSAKRSKIARSAANAAWKFMHSPAYQRIRNSNATPAQKRKQIEALKERRAA